MATVEISVVVPCRGHAAELAVCLQGLTRQSLDVEHEIVVVDSAGDPAVAEVVASFTAVRLVRWDGEPLFAGAARNLGVTQAQGATIAFIDSDCIPEPDWLAAATGALNKAVQVVGGPVLDARRFHPIASIDNLMQFIDFAPRRPDGPASHLPSGNLALRKEAFDLLGGFGPERQVGEDTILTSAAAARWPNGVRFVQRMRVRHAGRRSLGAFWRHQEDFGFHRGYLGLRMSRLEQRLARTAVGASLLAGKRLVYFVLRSAQWNPPALLRLVLLLPLVIVGLTAWSVGLRRGSRRRTADNS